MAELTTATFDSQIVPSTPGFYLNAVNQLHSRKQNDLKLGLVL